MPVGARGIAVIGAGDYETTSTVVGGRGCGLNRLIKLVVQE